MTLPETCIKRPVFATMAALTLTLFSFPYVVLSVRGTLLRLDPAFEEVSRSLGRGPWRTFLTVTLPLILPGILAGAIIGWYAKRVHSLSKGVLFGLGRADEGHDLLGREDVDLGS